MVVASAVLFSAKAIFAKLAYRYGADPTTVLTLRMAFALPLFAAASLRSEHDARIRLTRREWLLIVLLGSFGYYAAALLDFLGLRYVSAGLERLILFLYPVLVILLNGVFQGERVPARLWQTLLLGYAGVALVVWNDQLAYGSDVALGSTLIFVGCIAYAFYLSFSQPLIMRHGSTRITSHALVVACLCAFVQFAIAGDHQRLQQPWQVIALCAATAFLATVIPSFLLTAGIRRMGASRASLLGTVGPISTLLFAYWFLGEPITLLQILGSLLVLIGVLRISGKPAPAVELATEPVPRP
jgi:drug/metabolite transporter (DMT)-like permease